MSKFTCLFFVAALIACNTERQPQALSASNLTSTYVNIAAGKDTSITTVKGTTIAIQSGTFGKDVELEIKEAYSMADMLLAGLVTESNGELLQSDGMIYINTRNGENINLNKPIAISIPAGTTENMKLFKGEEKPDGTINWINPVTLNKVLDTPKAGKALFMQSCATCHSIHNRDITGPALAGIEKRVPDKKLLYAIIRNNKAVLKSGNPYFTKLWKEYNKTAMNLFPDLSDESIEAILAYIRSQEGPVPQVIPDGVAADSVPNGSDTSGYYAWQMTEGDTTGQSWVDTAMYADSISVEDYEASLRGGFLDQRWSDNNYTFEISTLGWYNIDAGMRGLAGTTLCDVKALVQNVPNGIELSKLTLYLFIPSRKNLAVGEQHADSRFYFEKWEGKIPLYTGDKAFLLAFGNKGDTFFYGITGFTVASVQEVTINLNRTTKDHFLKQVKELKFEGITFAVEKQ